MNAGIVSAVIALLFGIIKAFIHYSDVDPRSIIRDSVVVYISSLAGITLYDHLKLEKTSSIQAPVFTEKPNF
jgi:hypothetical protein